MAGRHGEAENQLYLGRPSNGEDSPTVQPLRISKQASPTNPGRYYEQPRANLPYPLPPGASSSANPLPYPDDEDTQYRYTPPKESRKNRAPYPDDERIGSPGRGARGSPLMTSTSSSAADMRRPSDNSRKTSYDTTPRLATSPVEKKGPRLGERRGAIPKPLPESPGPELPDKEGLFAKMPRDRQDSDTRYAGYVDREEREEQYYPPPGSTVATSAHQNIASPQASSVNRFTSSASTSTTRATRGSPPPPETPILGPGDQFDNSIEARYAAAGIAGVGTLTSLQARSAAATQRANQYGPPPVSQLPQSPEPAVRPWTPTESPDSNPHGPPTVYQGAAQMAGSQQNMSPHSHHGSGGSPNQTSTLEQDFARMQMSASPPPAYSSVLPPGVAANGLTAQGYPVEKRNTTTAQTATVKPSIASPLASPALQHPGHPAFANDPRQQQVNSSQSGHDQQSTPSQQFANASPFQGAAGPLSPPPPLPEGWLAHLDQISGQYYYIFKNTHHTQWEFPKRLTPVHDTPASPTLSTYGNPLASPGLSSFGKQGLGSPGYPPTPGYAESIMSMASQTPTAFTGPPPSAGVNMYKVAPTNGVYFGPYLRYINMDMERGVWLGSIMLVTDGLQPPTIHIHQSVDLSPNPRQLKANPISTHQRWTFYRYDIDLQMSGHGGDKWTYAITSHLGCTRYEFLVAGRYETNWRFIAHSGNDFAFNTTANERSKLGGIGFMWKNILQKNIEVGGFHVQLGLGDQIFGDRIWKEIPLLKQWLAMSGKENRKNAAWTARHEEDVSHAYFHYYTSHFDQPHLREAFAQIPHILQIDDHDIFDGFGSYPDYMQSSNMFKNIGRIGIEMYLLFQHHTTLEILRNVNTDTDLFTITGAGWHFVKYLGPAVVVVGPDCRSERTQQQVMAGPTYQGIFPKVATLPHSVQHCIWMISVPIVFPRLEAVESIAHTFTTAKKGVTGTYNLLGKMTSSVAGVVGGKEAVASGFSQVKKAVGKSGLMGGVLNAFGDIDIADELRDMWTHDSKDLERTYLIRTLQGIAQQKGIRMTFLSGDVNVCGAGLLHDPNRDSDHKTMYQIISSSIVTAPPSSYVLKLLHNNKPLYIPQNGHRSKSGEITDTKEDMMEIFQTDGVTATGMGNNVGGSRDMKKLMGRRNYVTFLAYDPEVVAGLQSPGAAFYGQGDGMSSAASIANASGGGMMRGNGDGSGGASVHSGNGGGYAERGVTRLNLAVDFVVQGDGTYSAPTQYGPVVIPSLEFGR